MIVKHYKGGIYKIITDARHTEEGYDLVIYQDEAGNVWARPSEMFWGKVEVAGEMKDRFTLMSNFRKERRHGTTANDF